MVDLCIHVFLNCREMKKKEKMMIFEKDNLSDTIDKLQRIQY
jgi:hypothetical protein